MRTWGRPSPNRQTSLGQESKAPFHPEPLQQPERLPLTISLEPRAGRSRSPSQNIPAVRGVPQLLRASSGLCPPHREGAVAGGSFLAPEGTGSPQALSHRFCHCFPGLIGGVLNRGGLCTRLVCDTLTPLECSVVIAFFQSSEGGVQL